jgi:hypothetical protein
LTITATLGTSPIWVPVFLLTSMSMPGRPSEPEPPISTVGVVLPTTGYRMPLARSSWSAAAVETTNRSAASASQRSVFLAVPGGVQERNADGSTAKVLIPRPWSCTAPPATAITSRTRRSFPILAIFARLIGPLEETASTSGGTTRRSGAT